MKKHYTLTIALLISILSFAQTTKKYKWSTAGNTGTITFNTLSDIGVIDLEDIGGFTSISFDGMLFNAASTLPVTSLYNGTTIDILKLVTELKKPSPNGKGSTFDPSGKKIIIIDNATTPVTKNITLKIKKGVDDHKKLTEIEQQQLITKSFLSGTGIEVNNNNNNNNVKYDWIYANSKYNRNDNIVLDEKTVHIFLDEFGNTLFSDFPTTAREDYNYSFHIYYTTQSNASSIKVQVRGLYEPTFEVYNSDALSSIGRATASSDSNGNKTPKAKVKVLNFEKKGPFTSSFLFNMKKIVDGEEKDVISNRVIKVAPVHHVSLMVGLVSTFLSNPTNITKGVNDNGDATLFADDPDSRGFVTLMAVFYPKPRNLLFPFKEFWTWERLGIVVGTRLDSDLNENFLGGLSYDLARGLSITGGIHYGRVNTIAANHDFNFGEDIFSGELVTKREWQANYFVGMNIDLRVFGFLFTLPVK